MANRGRAQRLVACSDAAAVKVRGQLTATLTDPFRTESLRPLDGWVTASYFNFASPAPPTGARSLDLRSSKKRRLCSR